MASQDSTSPGRQLHLGAFLSRLGAHVQAWRHPQSKPDSSVNIDTFIEAAQIAERGKFDFGFIADSTFITKDTTPYYLNRLEPLTALSAVAARTSNLGLVATATTSFSEPFTTARQINSLDVISKGRAAWNAVTGALEGHARNHGGEKLYDHALRYRIADEYIRVVKGLWDSWEDDAFIRDKASGKYVDFEKMHTLNHKGEFFSVQGPLNIERSPQGQPVLFQAGASEAGRALATREADAIFTGGVEDEAAAKAYYDDIKARLAANGRNPEHVSLLPQIIPIIGATEQEALRKHEEISELLDIDVALKYLSRFFSLHDFSQYPLDESLPDLGDLGENSFKSGTDKIKKLARDENLTLRQLALRVSSPDRGFVGTAEQVADKIQRLYETRVVDGFIITAYIQPLGLSEFVDHVVPLLQKRGIFRNDYTSDTLRGNLGVPIPKNRYAR